MSTITVGKFLIISRVDEEAINIESPIWKARLQRKNLEKGVELIEAGVMSRDTGLFVEDQMLCAVHDGLYRCPRPDRDIHDPLLVHTMDGAACVQRRVTIPP